MWTPGRLGSPPHLQNLTPLSFLQNLEVEAHVEAHVEATLALFFLPFTEWNRGYLQEMEVGVVGEIGTKGDTWQANQTHTWLAGTAFGRTTLVSLDSLSPGIQ
jgi:hypothetical protein